MNESSKMKSHLLKFSFRKINKILSYIGLVIVVTREYKNSDQILGLYKKKSIKNTFGVNNI